MSTLRKLNRKLKQVEKYFDGKTLDDSVPAMDYYMANERRKIKAAIETIKKYN